MSATVLPFRLQYFSSGPLDAKSLIPSGTTPENYVANNPIGIGVLLYSPDDEAYYFTYPDGSGGVAVRSAGGAALNADDIVGGTANALSDVTSVVAADEYPVATLVVFPALPDVFALTGADATDASNYLPLYGLGGRSVTEMTDVNSAGSGSIITGQERTDLNSNTADRHTHLNKAVIDRINDEGSTEIITATERAALYPDVLEVASTTDTYEAEDGTQTPYLSDIGGEWAFNFDPTAHFANLIVFKDSLSLSGNPITIVLPVNNTDYPTMWHCFFIANTLTSVQVKRPDTEPGGSVLPLDPVTLAPGFQVSVYNVSSNNSLWSVSGNIIGL